MYQYSVTGSSCLGWVVGFHKLGAFYIHFYQHHVRSLHPTKKVILESKQKVLKGQETFKYCRLVQ